jgi:RND family efflux transporter, MFP subunit
MNTKNLFKVLMIFLVAGVFISCNKKEEAVVEKETKVKVKTTVAGKRMVNDMSTYTASIQSEVTNQIIPAMGGRIERIFVEVGQKVSRGQSLVQMEDYNLQQQTVQLQTLKKDYERYSELLKVGGIAQQQVDQLKTQIDVLESAIDNIKKNTILRSPINGVVTARNYDNGDVFMQQPILTVEQLNPLKALVNVSEAYFPVVKKGLPVDIMVDVYGNEHFTGQVALVYPTIDAVTHTFTVEVAINNKEGKLAPGMYSRVTMNFGSAEQIVLPDIAVVKQSGSNDRYVFVVEGNKVRYSKVMLGQRMGEDVAILSGVNEGDEIVIAGQTRLIDGSEIEIIN